MNVSAVSFSSSGFCVVVVVERVGGARATNMKRGSQQSGREGPSLLQSAEIKLTDQPGPSMPINEAELSAAFDFFDMSGQVDSLA